jgi:beta-glucosidase/6-phospho-beta-glucosidase/beta-galactosidase
VYYADTVFSHLGRFVQKWITFNEPLVTCDLGFKAGESPEGPVVVPGLSTARLFCVSVHCVCVCVSSTIHNGTICLSRSARCPSNQYQQGCIT